MEEQRLLAVVNKWENVDRSKAADALKQLDKVWPQLEADSPLIALDCSYWPLMAADGPLIRFGLHWKPCMQVLTTARYPLLTTARAPVPHRFGLNWKPPRRSWLPNREGPS
jgi:hypothetical protein